MVRIRLFLDARRFPIMVGKSVQVLFLENNFFHLNLSIRDGKFDER